MRENVGEVATNTGEHERAEVVGGHAAPEEGGERLGDAARPVADVAKPVGRGQVGVDRTGAQGRDADAVRFEVHPHRLAVGDDAELADRVGESRIVGREAADRSGVHDIAAASLLAEHRGRLLPDVEDAVDVHVEYELPVVEGAVPHGAAEVDPGVVEDRVDATEFGPRRLEERLHRRRVAHVRRHGEGTGAPFAEIRSSGFHGVSIDVGEDEMGALTGEGAGDPRPIPEAPL